MNSAQIPYTQSPKTRRKWTEEEDQVLLKEVDLQKQQGTPADWKAIARKLPGRSNKDCRKRWNKIRACIAKGPWSFSEDESLKDAVRVHGLKWIEVSRIVKTRNSDQCAKRWRYALDPSIDRSVWRPQEDEALVTGVAQYGKAWKTISEIFLPTRSTTDIKNRYVTIMRYRRKFQRPSHMADLESNDGLDFLEFADGLSTSPSFSDISGLDHESLLQTTEVFSTVNADSWFVNSMNTVGDDIQNLELLRIMQDDASRNTIWPMGSTSDMTMMPPWGAQAHQPSAIEPFDWLTGMDPWTRSFEESGEFAQGDPFQSHGHFRATDQSSGMSDAQFGWQFRPQGFAHRC